MSTRNDDLLICHNAVFSHFIQVGRMGLLQMDLLPFLTQSQVDGGFDSGWFLNDHFEETLTLLKPVFELCGDPTVAETSDTAEKFKKSKDCVFTGVSVRIACAFKPHSKNNLFLITQFDTQKKSRHKEPDRASLFHEVRLHREKIVVYVCPRASSSVLQLSQLVCSDAENGKHFDDISKYFVSSERSAAPPTAQPDTCTVVSA